jgi:hypothetical protein
MFPLLTQCFTGKYKLALMAGSLVLVFAAGFKTASSFAAAEQLKHQKQVQQQLSEQRNTLLQEFLAQRQRDSLERATLVADLEALRTRERDLLAEVEDLQLTPKEVRVERIVKTIPGECGETNVVVANPIGDNFVRLWNASASGEPFAGHTDAGETG